MYMGCEALGAVQRTGEGLTIAQGSHDGMARLQAGHIMQHAAAST
jgi:hypothetical protein